MVPALLLTCAEVDDTRLRADRFVLLVSCFHFHFCYEKRKSRRSMIEPKEAQRDSRCSSADKVKQDHGTSCSPVLGVLPFPTRCFCVCGAAQWSNIGCTWRAI